MFDILSNSLFPSSDKFLFSNNSAFTFLFIIFLIVVYVQIKRGSEIIFEEIKGSTVYIRDTVYVEPPKIYQCWVCSNDLKFSNNNATCCNFVYHITNNKLNGTKKD